jgi:DNA-binding CsgD family transcriptional regulator
MAQIHFDPNLNKSSASRFPWPNAVQLDEINGLLATDQSDLDTKLASLSGRLGFDYFSLVIGAHVPRRTTEVAVRSSYVPSWQQRYREHAYSVIDPIVQAAPAARRPFVWGREGDLTGITPVAERLMNEGRTYFIRFGISVPTHGPNGEFTLLTMVTGQTKRALEDLVRSSHNLLWMIAPLVHDAASQGTPQRSAHGDEEAAQSFEVTDHQKKCLALTLQGKTSGEIAEIILRSRATVEYHLQKAMRHFGVRSKIAAAMAAMKAGIIDA